MMYLFHLLLGHLVSATLKTYLQRSLKYANSVSALFGDTCIRYNVNEQRTIMPHIVCVMLYWSKSI